MDTPFYSFKNKGDKIMSERKTLEQLTNGELHISHSQISCYQNCSLKYFFRYVEGRKAESVNVSLPFGSAIHTALATYYRGIKNGHVESLEVISDCFTTAFTLDVEASELPIIYNKTTPDKESLIAIGTRMIEAYYKSIDPNKYEVVEVELPLAASLYNPDRKPTDYKLVGVINLLLRNKSGDLIVVDFKTASKSMSQEAVNQNEQLTSYSYLLIVNKYIAPTASVECRFDVILKTKEPKLQQITTTRNKADRKRFAKVASVVLSGISNRVFMPVQSWLCSSCEYMNACRDWSN